MADTLGFEVATDRCSRYALAGGELLRGPPPSTALVRQLLDDEEERVGLSIVDVANAVQREMGQPLHLFDAAKVSGRLVVRESEAGERCRPLFKDEWVELPRGTLVVADDRAIHAVAGIIGCQDAEVTDDTRDILVEAACFDPVTIRKASRALGISTAASQRFERGSDPGAVTQALERFATLASEAGLGRVSTRSPLHAAAMDFQRCIPFSLARLRACLGWDLAGEVVEAALIRYGYGLSGAGDDWTASVPTWRFWDVETDAALFEDVARAMSYQNCPEAPPPAMHGSLPGPSEVDRASIRSQLAAQGFFEVFTDAFYSAETRERLLVDGETDPLWRHVEVVGAIDRRYSMLRNNCVAQAVEAVDHNLRFSEHNVRLFEMCRTYHPNPVVGGPVIERDILWVAWVGDVVDAGWRGEKRSAEYWDMAGCLRSLSDALRRDVARNEGSSAEGSGRFLHPERRSRIVGRDGTIGVIGEIHPDVARRFGVDQVRIQYLELEVTSLLNLPARDWHPRLPPIRPPSRRTISFVLPPRVEARAVSKAIDEVASSTATVNVRVADSFDLPNHEGRSVTFELTMNGPQSSLSSKNIADLLGELAVAVPEKLATSNVRFRS